MTLTLHQFEFSHFNDKARWALAFKQVPHERVSYLPGPHMPQIKKLSGQQQTPVLQSDSSVIAGSSAIIDYLEHEYPEPALYPADATLREQALKIQTRFDEQVGPAARTALFSALIDEPDYIVAMFARSASAPKRFLYRATFPLAKRLIAKGNGVTSPARVEAAFEAFEAALAEVEQTVATSGYMVGDEFSVADLTAAALLAPFASLSHVDMARPQPVPERVAALLERYQDRPALAWVRDMYAHHRPE